MQLEIWSMLTDPNLCIETDTHVLDKFISKTRVFECYLDSTIRPLIRIIGDRFPWQVKSSILGTLGVLINKGEVAVKPFLPQLQTAFIKCLQDNARTVRSRAAWALGIFIRLSTRVDPLVGDLLTGLQTAEGRVREATLVALEGVIAHAGKSVSATMNARLLTTLQGMLSSEEDVVRTYAAKTLGIVSQAACGRCRIFFSSACNVHN